MYHFANILFSGPCNLACPYCIGRRIKNPPDNLNTFPLRGIGDFMEALNQKGIRQISLTGTNTDPQLYRHEKKLIDYLRRKIPEVKLSLHTNGTMAIRKMDVFNSYDRATISLPAFSNDVYRKMTGKPTPPDVETIIEKSHIPIKISTILTSDNASKIPDIIERCRELGIRRMVIRNPYGSSRPTDIFDGMTPVRVFGGNPVYISNGMEITHWDFSKTDLTCLNLFSDGVITDRYRIGGQS